MWLNPTLLEALAGYLAEIYALDLGSNYSLIPVASFFSFFSINS
jgi:hypothetical protein